MILYTLCFQRCNIDRVFGASVHLCLRKTSDIYVVGLKSLILVVPFMTG